MVEVIEGYTRAIADALEVKGPLNVQYAVQRGTPQAGPQVFVIEANPRASRTVPFVSKATGVPLAKGGGASDDRRHARRPCGRRACCGRPSSGYVSVKEAVLPFDRFPRRRQPPRPRDAFDGRGDGDRQHLRPRLRQEPDGSG